MGQFKKHNWMRYGRFGNIAKIEIFDDTERRIDHFVCNDNEGYTKAISTIERKYGFKVKPEIGFNESINAIKKEEVNRKKEVDWLAKDMDW